MGQDDVYCCCCCCCCCCVALPDLNILARSINPLAPAQSHCKEAAVLWSHFERGDHFLLAAEADVPEKALPDRNYNNERDCVFLANWNSHKFLQNKKLSPLFSPLNHQSAVLLPQGQFKGRLCIREEHDASPFVKSANLKALSLEDKKRDEVAKLVRQYVTDSDPDSKFDRAPTIRFER